MLNRPGTPGRGSGDAAAPAGAGAASALVEAPARLLGTVPWLFCATLAVVGVAGVTPLAWIAAGVAAGLSLSGSV